MAPRVVALTLLFTPLPMVAAPPVPKPEAVAQETVGGLRDQLIASLRADIIALKQGKQPDTAGVERLTQAIEMLARETDTTDVRRVSVSMNSEQRGTGYSWVGVVQAQGSEKSATLASRLNGLQQRERAAAETTLLERAEALGKRVGPAALQAKTAKDLDPLLVEIAEVSAPGLQGRYAGSGVGVFQQLAALSQFVTGWQNVLVLIEAGRQPEALQALRNLGGSERETPWIPRSELTRQLGEAARRAGKPTSEEISAQMNALVEKALAAETAEAIDPLLASARKLQALLQNDDSGSNSHRFYAVVTFLERWQDFYLARTAGNAAKVKEIITQLNNSEIKQLDLPRSRLLERIYALSGAAADGDTPDSRRSPRPKTAGNEEKIEKPEAVVARMQKLEDLAGNLYALERAATFESGQPYPSEAWGKVLIDMNSIYRDYQQLKSGQAVRVTLGLANSMSTASKVGALREELAIFAVRRLVGDDAQLAPQDGDSALTYLRRLLAAARERKDWRLVQRILETGQSTGVQDPLLKTSDSTALTSFLSGMTQERAGQFAVAVMSYQAALKTGSELLPVDDIGVRLARIKKDQPAAYEQGVLWTVSPPPSRDPYGRPLPYDRSTMPPTGNDRPGEKAVLVPEKKPSAAPATDAAKPADKKPEESAPAKP